MTTGLRLSDADHATLVDAWESAIESFTDLAEIVTDEQWLAPSGLPGWTNADVVAHVIGIERDLLGEAPPNLDIDWELLPHADDLFSRYTELPVAARRGVDRAEVLAELRKTIPARRAQLSADAGDLGEIVSGPGGWQLPRGVVLRMRIFDIWLHDQDLRRSTGTVGELDTDAAWVAADRMVGALGYSWSKLAGAPIGSSVAISVTGPGVAFRVAAVVADNGRGQLVSADSLGEPDVDVAMSWPDYAALCAGRIPPSSALVAIEGDPDLAARLLPALEITP